MTPEPTVSDLLRAAAQAISGKDKVADLHRGSDYESLSGPNAILWSRQARRDTDLARAIRFHDASGSNLTSMGEKRYKIPRILPTRGQGAATLSRATSAGGAGTIWKGTRIRLTRGDFSEPRYFRVTADTPVSATTLHAAPPIEAVAVGTGNKASASSGLSIDDPLWDTTWVVTALECSDGTDLEAAQVYQARIRQERRDSRVGQPTAIEDICRKTGADQVAIFRSNYGGEALDFGLNFVYVGDSGYSGTAQLVRACTKALRGVRVCGDHLQVGALNRAVQVVDVDIYLSDSPQVLPIDRIERIHRQAIIQYFNTANGRFSYSRSGLEAALARSVPQVQEVNIVTPASDAGVLVGGSFPATLNRYFAEDAQIYIRYYAPK